MSNPSRTAALATMLLIAGTVHVQGFVRLASVDPGYDPTDVLTFQISRPGGGVRATLGDEMTARIRSLPGVRNAGYTLALPMVQTGFRTALRTSPGEPPPPPRRGPSPSHPDSRVVSAQFLETMRIRLVAGRYPTSLASPKGPTGELLINRTLAESGFLGPNAIGREVFVGPFRSTIVGIVEDVRQFGLDREPEAQVLSVTATTTGSEYYAVRTEGPPASVVPQIRALLAQLDPVASLDNVATMEQILASSIGRPRLYAWLMGGFAALALTIATVGLYAVVAYAVRQRTREIGVRRALGASAGDVSLLVLRDAFTLAVAGILIGVVGTVALTGVLASNVFGLARIDPAAYVVAAVGFAAIATAAAGVAVLPALRRPVDRNSIGVVVPFLRTTTRSGWPFPPSPIRQP